jgi:hypothetical protein
MTRSDWGVGAPVVETLNTGVVRRRTPIDVSFTVANRGGYTEVFLVPSEPPGPLAASLRIDWSVRELVELSPARVALTFPGSGEVRRSQVVHARPLDGRTIPINRITTTDPGITARVVTKSPPPSETTDFEVTVALPEGKRLLSGDIVLHLGTQGSPEVRIPVTAIRTGGAGASTGP